MVAHHGHRDCHHVLPHAMAMKVMSFDERSRARDGGTERAVSAMGRKQSKKVKTARSGVINWDTHRGGSVGTVGGYASTR
jgi:hypothetical protein